MTAHEAIEDTSDPLVIATDPVATTTRTMPVVVNTDFTVGASPVVVGAASTQDPADQWISEPTYKVYDDLNDTSLHQNDTFTLTPDVKCTLSGGSDVTYSIEPTISWISVDSEGNYQYCMRHLMSNLQI